MHYVLDGTSDDLTAKISAQATFVAANLLGLQAGGVTAPLADGIDKTRLAVRQVERNTRPLRDADEISFT